MDDLKEFGVPVLILSGGEPLLRPDVFEISQRAKALGFYVGLSSNGTLIDAHNIGAIAALGYDYVGISIDGMRETHDRFRRRQGAFDASLRGIRLCREHGIKVGLRFTPDPRQRGGAARPARPHGGRGDRQVLPLPPQLRGAREPQPQVRRRAPHHARGDGSPVRGRLAATRTGGAPDREYVTGNNDADGVYLLHCTARRFPARVAHLRAKLAQWGGNSSGVNVANIDNLGVVHPDTFWWHYPLGNVRERPFSEIWRDPRDALMSGLRQQPRPVKGRCGACGYLDVCGGNTRVRAHRTTGDPWAEDPACYLFDQELDLRRSARREA